MFRFLKPHGKNAAVLFPREGQVGDGLDGCTKALGQLYESMTGSGLKDGEVFHQRNDADNNDDDLNDLARPAVDRQTLNQIEDEDDHKKGDQDTDQQ